MSKTNEAAKLARLNRFMAVTGLLALIFSAVSLRPPVAAVGPLLDEIAADLHLGAAQVSLLAAAPVFCFGLGAFLGPWLARNLGLHAAMRAVILLLASSIMFRAATAYNYWMVLAFTLVIGLAIAVGNVLLPTIVRTDYPKRIALITGVYTTLLALSASFAASFAVPLSATLGGWQWSLLVWAAPAALAGLFWTTQARRPEPAPAAGVAHGDHSHDAEKAAVRTSPITWALVGFFGLQSLGFYALLNWMPTALIAAGAAPAAAGQALGLTTAIGIPFGLLLSAFAGRFKSLAWWSAAASALTAIGFTIVLVEISAGGADVASRMLLGGLLIGMGQASTFPLSLSLIGSKASTKAQTTMLSALSQGWGYLFAAVGTLAIGLLADLTHGWVVPFVVLIAATLVQIPLGFVAGRPGQIPAANRK